MDAVGKRERAMTPTLMGRWQTRVLLMLVLGALPTVVYMAAFGAFEAGGRGTWKLPLILAYAIAVGLVWDVPYVAVQSLRWDRDWPYAFQFASGIFEGCVLFGLFAGDLLPGVVYEPGDAWRFALHYGTVFLLTFGFVFGPMRVLFPRWRFMGGRVV
jgi:hypothetical protein